MRTDLLIIVPHPDDEAFGAGGTLIDYAGRGLKTGLITLTRGDQGKDLGLATRETLAEVREEELRKCAAVLNIDYLEICRYPDKGVADHPEAVDFILWRLMLLRPRALITFAPNGSNGHTDHVATSKWVREAVRRYAEPLKLFYYTGPKPNPGFEDTWLPPSHFRHLSQPTAERKLQALSHHRTQALSVMQFFERFPFRLNLETFHLVGYDGPPQNELL
jgi:LmbE family N-acetylglucosaminyl deacetylase